MLALQLQHRELLEQQLRILLLASDNHVVSSQKYLCKIASLDKIGRQLVLFQARLPSIKPLTRAFNPSRILPAVWRFIVCPLLI